MFVKAYQGAAFWLFIPSLSWCNYSPTEPQAILLPLGYFYRHFPDAMTHPPSPRQFLPCSSVGDTLPQEGDPDQQYKWNSETELVLLISPQRVSESNVWLILFLLYFSSQTLDFFTLCFVWITQYCFTFTVAAHTSVMNHHLSIIFQKFCSQTC